MRLSLGNTSFTQSTHVNLIRYPSTWFPYSLTVNDISVVGNGSSYDLTVINSAFGEYLERDHFYNRITSDKTMNYRSCNSSDLCDAVTLLINQVKETPHNPEEHSFNLTKVANIYTEETAYLPTVLLSLADDYRMDREFIPYIDTCGQACHQTSDSALSGALLEFVERQALINAWLRKDFGTKIIINDLPQMIRQLPFVEKLQANGEILYFDISNNFQVPIILVVYFSHSNLDIVKYSVGLAADFNPLNACRKALLELWQTYCFLYLNAERRQWNDTSGKFRYLYNLLKFNDHHTKLIFDFENSVQSEICIEKYLECSISSMENLKEHLYVISKHIFAYCASSICYNEELCFCKIISPDFFIHMDTTLKLNYSNAYTESTGTITESMNKTSIPFP